MAYYLDWLYLSTWYVPRTTFHDKQKVQVIELYLWPIFYFLSMHTKTHPIQTKDVFLFIDCFSLKARQYKLLENMTGTHIYPRLTVFSAVFGLAVVRDSLILILFSKCITWAKVRKQKKLVLVVTWKTVQLNSILSRNFFLR